MSNQDNIQKLMNKYPLLYRDGKVELGFYVGNGWIPLMNALSSVLSNEISSMPLEIRDHFYVIQVKEKFGVLRVYLSRSTPFLDGALSVVESLSTSICEECGCPGRITVTATNWTKTKCDSCSEKK